METGGAQRQGRVSAAIAAADRLAVGHGHGPIHHFHRFRQAHHCAAMGPHFR